MNYVIFKVENRREFRLYAGDSEFDGQIIYKGHKLGVESSLLYNLIDYRIERSTNKIYFLKYDKVKENVTTIDKNLWISSNSESFDNKILESWNSIQNVLEEKVGKFRKVIITVVNI